MPRRFTVLAWTAAACAYLLIVLGAVVRITGSGLGCGDHWPLCNGHLVPPLDDLGTVIEWSHRLVAAVVSALVFALAGYAWWLRERARSTEQDAPGRASYVALGLLIVQVLLGAVTVKTGLTPAMVILHLATAMLLLAALVVAARPRPLSPAPQAGRRGTAALLGLGFVTVLFGALTANLGAAAACAGFPLCSGRIIPAGGVLEQIHWTHRLLAYALLGYVVWWAAKSRERRAWGVGGLVVLQVVIAAAMVLSGLPGAVQAAHAAVGAGVWTALVIAAR